MQRCIESVAKSLKQSDKYAPLIHLAMIYDIEAKYSSLPRSYLAIVASGNGDVEK